MPTSSHDVVVLGTRLTPLLCAALLAGRGLRVLVIGQGTPPPSYELGGVIVEREPFPMVGSRSPAVLRVFEELAVKQELRQRVPEAPPPFQLLLGKQRLDLESSAEAWDRELSREAPETRRQGMDVVRTLDEVREELDALVARPLPWPPETFVERQQFAFAAATLRFDRQGKGWSSWRQLPGQSPIRAAFDASLPLLSGLLPTQHSDMSRARLHGLLFSDVATLEGGRTWLQDALVSRVRSWGGDVRIREQAQAIIPDGRRGHILRLARSGEEIGCTQLVHGTPVAELSQLIAERGALGPLFERVGEPRVRGYRCSVHALLARVGVPRALEPLALLRASPDDVAFLTQTRLVGADRALISMSRFVDEHQIDTGSSPLRFVRDDALRALRTIVPFVDEHIVWLDSPHDGLPPVSFSDTDLACSDPWTRGPHTMEALYEYPTRRALGVCALPTRCPVPSVFLCNDQVAPGSSFEGAFLAAASAARAIGRSYRRQDRLRRRPWAHRFA